MCAAAATAAAAETQIMCQSVYRGGGGGEETAAAAARTPRNIANTKGWQEASQEKTLNETRKNQDNNKYQSKEQHGRTRAARAKQNNKNANRERQLDQKDHPKSNQSPTNNTLIEYLFGKC